MGCKLRMSVCVYSMYERVCELRGRRYVHHSSVKSTADRSQQSTTVSIYSDTRGSTGSFQFNVPSSRQYIPLYNLHTDVLEFVLE